MTLPRLIFTIFGFVQGLPKKKIQPSLLDPSTSPQLHVHKNSLSRPEASSPFYRSEVGGSWAGGPWCLGSKDSKYAQDSEAPCEPRSIHDRYNLGERLAQLISGRYLFSFKALSSLKPYKTSGFCSRDSLNSILYASALAILQSRPQGSSHTCRLN